MSQLFSGKDSLGDLMQPPFKNSFYRQGFFAVKRRAVFVFDSIRDTATMYNHFPLIRFSGWC